MFSLFSGLKIKSKIFFPGVILFGKRTGFFLVIVNLKKEYSKFIFFI